MNLKIEHLYIAYTVSELLSVVSNSGLFIYFVFDLLFHLTLSFPVKLYSYLHFYSFWIQPPVVDSSYKCQMKPYQLSWALDLGNKMQKEHWEWAIRMFRVPLIFLYWKGKREKRNGKMTFVEEKKSSKYHKIDLCFIWNFPLFVTFISLLISREQKRYGVTPLKKAVDLQRLTEVVSIG